MTLVEDPFTDDHWDSWGGYKNASDHSNIRIMLMILYKRRKNEISYGNKKATDTLLLKINQIASWHSTEIAPLPEGERDGKDPTL